MRVTAKSDYAVRAMVELAAASSNTPVKAETVAAHQGIPLRFTLGILADLRVAKLVESRRGNEGGYRLAFSPAEISVADVIRAVEGPLADVHGTPPEALEYPEPATAMREVWVATRAALRGVLESVTLQHVASGQLPDNIDDELVRPGAQQRR